MVDGRGFLQWASPIYHSFPRAVFSERSKSKLESGEVVELRACGLAHEALRWEEQKQIQYVHKYIYIYISLSLSLQRGKPRFRHRASRCVWAGAFCSRRVGVGAKSDKARELTVFVQGGR